MAWFIPERFSDNHCRRHGWWVLLALTALLYLPGLGTLPLMDRDEPRFAHATVEMMQRSAWVVPYFNSDPEMSDATRIELMRKGKGAMEVGYRFDKPPLTYWWMRLHYALFGINEFAARLHSVLAVWLVALVTFGLTSRIAGARAGLAAGIAWLTTLQIIIHGRLAVADMPMVLFVALACWALMECLLGSLKSDGEAAPSSPASDLAAPTFSFWHWTLYLSLGLGFLAKGPIALLVPGLALVLYRFAFWRKPLAWKRLKLWPGFLITLVIMGAWGIPALIETQGLYWKVGMQEHVVDRGAKAFNGRFPVPGYYLATALLSLFPWIGLLPMVWTKVREKWDAKMAFMVSWLTAPYIIFTLYATQLPHYVMPGFPAAMVLLMVCGLDMEKPSVFQRVWLIVTTLVLAVPLCLLALMMMLIPSAADYAWAVTFFVVGLFTLAIPLTRFSAGIRKLTPRRRALQSVLGMVIFAAGLAMCCTQLRNVHPAAQLAAKAGPLPDKVDLVGWQFAEPSLIFHFNHYWRFPNKLNAVNERMSRKGPRIVVLLRREWTLSRALKEKWEHKTELSTEQDFSKEVDEVIAAHPDYQVVEFSGMNAARASWTELRMLVRKSP